MTDTRIEAAISRWPARHPIEASASKGKAHENLRQAFQHLMSGLPDEDHEAVWRELREKGQADEMVEIFEENARLDPDNPEAQALGFWPPMFGKQEARATRASEFARTYPIPGNLNSQQGNKDKAMEAWRKGATLFPDNAQLRTKIGNQGRTYV